MRRRREPADCAPAPLGSLKAVKKTKMRNGTADTGSQPDRPLPGNSCVFVNMNLRAIS
jgi:hypothetical protein